eukprot:TRINITY_DN4813_c0_g1_i2.p3 TRINITY_DN4813_c0_g1~~TRINITY_DN4813_c0_g1_i2.p3  ORF type:complete len:103 (+),score=9.77 TRINITY_DN4813_c0_g1_i2:197-505(+)
MGYTGAVRLEFRDGLLYVPKASGRPDGTAPGPPPAGGGRAAAGGGAPTSAGAPAKPPRGGPGILPDGGLLRSPLERRAGGAGTDYWSFGPHSFNWSTFTAWD